MAFISRLANLKRIIEKKMWIRCRIVIGSIWYLQLELASIWYLQLVKFMLALYENNLPSLQPGSRQHFKNIPPGFSQFSDSFIVILNIKSLRTPVPGPPHHIDHFISHLVNHHGSHLVLKNGPSSRQPRRSPCRPPCHFIHSHMCVLHICVLDGVKNVTDQWSNRRTRWF